MKRKVVKQGASTLTVSLPSKWSQKFGLKSGDEIHVEEKDNSLLFSCTNPHFIEKKVIDANELDFLVNRSIIGAYRTGHDEIKIISNETSKIDKFKNVVSELLGFELLEEGSNFCVLRDVSGSSDREFDNLYRRSFLLIKNVTEESLEMLKAGKKNGLKSLVTLDKEVNKFTNNCLRHLNKKGYKEFTKTQMIFLVVHKLEEIGDEHKNLLNKIVDEDVDMNNVMLSLYQQVQELFGKTYEFSFKHRSETAKEIGRMYKENKKDIQEAIMKVQNPSQIKVLFHLDSLNNKIIKILGSQLSFI